MNSLVEQQRTLHAESELLVRNAASALLQRTKRDGLLADSRAASLLALHQLKAKQLLGLYADSDGSRAAEIQGLTTTADDISAFDVALKEIQASHAAQSWNEFVAPTDLELDTRDLEAEQEGMLRRLQFAIMLPAWQMLPLPILGCSH
jgi:hypothetical protein